METVISPTNSASTETLIETLETEQCPLCRGTSNEIDRGLSDRLFHVPGIWGHRRCLTCNLVWLNPMPAEDQLVKLYADYYTHSDTPSTQEAPATEPGRTQPSSVLLAVRALYRFLIRFSPLAKKRHKLDLLFLENETRGRMLELGAGSGERLLKFKELGWQVEGHDLDPQAASFAQRKTGVTMHVGLIQDLQFKEQFDLILMNHVLEHVFSPAQTLHSIFAMLKPGGLLAFCVPNGQSYNFKKYGANWLHLDPPRHLYIFDPENLKSLAGQVGFQVEFSEASKANATAAIRGSRSIRKNGRYRLGTSRPLNEELAIFCDYALMLVRGFFAPLQGDDLVMHFRKPKRATS